MKIWERRACKKSPTQGVGTRNLATVLESEGGKERVASLKNLAHLDLELEVEQEVLCDYF